MKLLAVASLVIGAAAIKSDFLASGGHRDVTSFLAYLADASDDIRKEVATQAVAADIADKRREKEDNGQLLQDEAWTNESPGQLLAELNAGARLEDMTEAQTLHSSTQETSETKKNEQAFLQASDDNQDKFDEHEMKSDTSDERESDQDKSWLSVQSDEESEEDTDAKAKELKEEKKTVHEEEVEDEQAKQSKQEIAEQAKEAESNESEEDSVVESKGAEKEALEEDTSVADEQASKEWAAKLAGEDDQDKPGLHLGKGKVQKVVF